MLNNCLMFSFIFFVINTFSHKYSLLYFQEKIIGFEKKLDFWFSTYLYVFEELEHGLTVFRKLLSVVDKNFICTLFQELILEYNKTLHSDWSWYKSMLKNFLYDMPTIWFYDTYNLRRKEHWCLLKFRFSLTLQKVIAE